MTGTELITKFYESFASSNSEEMINCYHENIRFEDPAFGTLIGSDAKHMWRMLIERSKGEIKITCSEIKANDTKGSAKWIAEYNFSKTGRKVVIPVSAEFEFHEGKIIKHVDIFDVWKWSMQAFGWKGYFFGWSSYMKNKIQSESNLLLRYYVKNSTLNSKVS